MSEGAGLRGLVRDRPLLAFLVLAICLSWAWWLPIALTGGTRSHFPGLLGPLLAAVVVSAVCEGRPGLRRLRGRLGAPRWWLLALAPLFVGAVAVTVVSTVGDGPSIGDLASMPGLPAWSWLAVFSLVFLVGGLGEEVGWRGLAWTRLRRSLGLRDAALVLTVDLPLLGRRRRRRRPGARVAGRLADRRATGEDACRAGAGLAGA